MSKKSFFGIFLVSITIMFFSTIFNCTQERDDTNDDASSSSSSSISSSSSSSSSSSDTLNKLPSKFTLKTPKSLSNSGGAMKTRSPGSSGYDKVNGLVQQIEMQKSQVSMMFIVVDEIIKDYTTSNVPHASFTLPPSDTLKTKINEFLAELGITGVPPMESFPIGSHIYDTTTDAPYNYYYREEGNMGTLLIKWSEDKKAVLVSQSMNMPDMGDMDMIFTYDDTKKVAKLVSKGSFTVPENTDTFTNISDLSFAKDANSTKNGAFISFTMSFSDAINGTVKSSIEGYADDDGGYLSESYTFPNLNGIPDTMYYREAFDKDGTQTYYAYDDDGNWVVIDGNVEAIGGYDDTFNNEYSVYKDDLKDPSLVEDIYGASDDIKYYDITGAELGDCYLVTNALLSDTPPEDCGLAAINGIGTVTQTGIDEANAKLLGYGSCEVDGKVMVTLFNIANSESATIYYFYKLDISSNLYELVDANGINK